MVQRTRNTTVEERLTWDPCPVCKAGYQELCNSTIEPETIFIHVESSHPVHEARLKRAPMAYTLQRQ